MNKMEQLKAALKEGFPAFMIKMEEPLSRHTSFRIGGPAEVMVFPNKPRELAQILAIAKSCEIKPMILGAGTNILAPDEGIRGLVICLRDCFMGLTLLPDNQMEAMAGMTLAQTAMFAARNNLSGLEFAHGIPGTVGGAVYMNAGAYGGEIKDVAIATEFMDLDGNCTWIEGEAQGFSYRNSCFQGKEGIILRTRFRLLPGEEGEIRNRIYELNEKRRASQPLDRPSAGSTFKRPAQGYAAALIQEAGLKGLQVGGAAVSEKHSGFVVNLGGATAADVLALVEQVQQRVQEHSGILLEPEVRLWATRES